MFKKFADIVKAQAEVQNSFFVTSTFYKGIPVYKENGVVLARTGTYSNTPNAYTTLGDGKPVIFVNDAFSKLPKKVQDDILLAQYGYIKSGALDNPTKLFINSIVNVNGLINQADAYANGHSYTYKETLKFLRDNYPNTYKARAINKRLAKLKG